MAEHNLHAGRLDDAFRWSLLAADDAVRLHAPDEQAIHLRRACDLWTQVGPVVSRTDRDRVLLLRRTSAICSSINRQDLAVDLLSQGLELLDWQQDPLLASDLLVRRSLARWRLTTPRTVVPDDALRAVELGSTDPDSPEYAIALSELAAMERWEARPGALEHANAAVDIARRTASVDALVRALSRRALATSVTDPPAALADAEEAAKLARTCGDLDGLLDATSWQFNALVELGRSAEATQTALSAYRELVEGGAGKAVHFLAFMVGWSLIEAGRWADARSVIRTALAARCVGVAGAATRLTATLLAVRSGQVAEARQHLERAHDLASDEFPGLYDCFALCGAEVLLAENEPQAALDWLQNHLPQPGHPVPETANDLLIASVQAAAEVAQNARDRGDKVGVARAASTIEQMLTDWQREPFSAAGRQTDLSIMNKALFDAEFARARGDAQAELWRSAAGACRTAGYLWGEVCAQFRFAEAALGEGYPVSAVGGTLRSAYRCASEMGAQPLRGSIVALARRSRISLVEPTPTAAPAEPTILSALTERELQILSYVAAGRSNTEIAKDLVISHKTVSVHVSNILRKTGTSSRTEAAALADRLRST
ncbi:helix-turn-helix transcriptional regulator [Kribbella sp. NPDC026596]|uniref:helix-turn-helix transcriptional regulator n=1 Tax=Kribbella sp. NPDC026596 TaxID=3155122 RepID=UPI0033E71FDF